MPARNESTRTVDADHQRAAAPLGDAVDEALKAGDARRAATLIAEAPSAKLDRLDLAQLRALLGRIGTAVDEVPGALLAHARLLELTVHTAERREILDRLEPIAAERGDEGLTLAVLAERARDHARDGEVDAAINSASKVLAMAQSTALLVRARAQAALGRAYSFRRGPGDAVRAAELLAGAAAMLGQLGERIGQAHTLLWLGYGALLPEGSDEQALTALARAASVAPSGSRIGEIVTSFWISALLDAGRPNEAEELLGALEGQAVERNDSRVLGYAAWNRATAAALRNDSVALPVLLAAVERYRSDWFEHPTGAEFLANASEMAQRLGNQALAAAYLARAEERAAGHGYPAIAAAARAGYEARFGDPVQAERLLHQAATDAEVARRDRWRITALQALAAARGGDEARARQLAAAAVEEAASLGLAHLIVPTEPVLAERLLGLATAGGSAAARQLRRITQLEPMVEVNLLGAFRVTVDGEDRTPTGQPATLLKLIALLGGRVAVDEVIETLWPEQDEATGRRRLRNLLNRLSAMSGPLIHRDGEMLRLPAAIDVSAIEAELATVRAGGAAASGAARRALQLARGTLLPDDPYADWAVIHRERLHHGLARAADLLARQAEADGELGAQIAWLECALDVEPWALERHVQIVQLAAAAGDRAHERYLARRAEAAYRELELPLPPEVSRALSG